jgi:hypothetical protein
VQTTLFDHLETGADFSPCRTWRYRLWRRWSSGPALNVIGLNPSTADESTDDATITRLTHRAREWGYPALVMTNLFALRSTDPCALRPAADPVGPENDGVILTEAQDAGLVLCAWGKDGNLRARGKFVEGNLRLACLDLYALKLGKDGSPMHPLYLPYSLSPVLWR